ncbi:MAG: sodium-translocating pyrophosphatase [Candidatus Bathyarchaeia archaeon]|nr:sodium-translocating pyrophosphatase [Candidatus Bathyarchaeota archaeon]MDI9578085.1 sodium-translocating pyrophosphatase [Thermoproteota archaeon]MDT8781561.1 sodium-translocating pyrophosphatase [Candidatus Bathyarchaeota archaeon]NLD66047.1 sodium-translocating pyrophosphatase [Thermoproteota archaeon]
MIFWIAPFAGVLAVVASLILMNRIGKMSPGGPKTVEVGNAIREGAYAFLKRQYKTIGIITVVLFVLLWIALPYGPTGELNGPFGVGTAAAFLVGAVASLAAGYIAMDNATKANVRTVAAAKEFGAEKALKTAFYGGATMGLAVVGLSLLGVSFLFMLYGGFDALFGTLDAAQSASLARNAASGIVGMGFGASLIALFAQLGGGIYTKAADVGADLVGKVEAGIPEDDPRNPAVIADNVGDNVGDSAGRGADLFESATGENIGGMIIGGIISIATGNLIFLIFPLIARALGIFATFVGMPFVRLSEKEAKHPMKALRKGLMVTTIVAGILFFIATIFLLGNMYLFYCLLAGLAASVAIDYITDYYTGRDRSPVVKIAKASETGSATNIITGFAVGLETTALPIVSLAIALIASYWFGTQFGAEIGIDPFIGGIYGTTLATMGMLAVMGMILALDGFGPIADNAAGIAEMSGEGGAEATMEALDAVGNTTKALTKGFALGSALLAAQLLFQTYIEEVHLITGQTITIDISNPAVLVAGFIGAMIPFFFSSQAISAVGKAAGEMVAEVRRQFREIPGIMEGTSKPEYGKAVDISTKSALKGMVLPALIVVIVPLIVGVLMGAEAVGALVIGATLSAVPLALLMNTGGGAWDNAKKHIEAGNFGGKNSPAHAAAVVGDTVGDPMKDTAGPSLHVLIKLLSTLSIVFIPLFFNLLNLI